MSSACGRLAFTISGLRRPGQGLGALPELCSEAETKSKLLSWYIKNETKEPEFLVGMDRMREFR